MLDFHPEAVQELESSFEWYLARSPKAASEFLAAVRRALSDIVKSPDRWQRDSQGFRRTPLIKLPFNIIHRETNRGVRVVAIAHTSREQGYWRTRR